MPASQEEIAISDEKLDEYSDYDDFDGNVEEKVKNLELTESSLLSVFEKILKVSILSSEPAEKTNQQIYDNYKVNTFALDLHSESNFVKLQETHMNFSGKFKQNQIKVAHLSFTKPNPLWWSALKDYDSSEIFMLSIFDENLKKVKRLLRPINYITTYEKSIPKSNFIFGKFQINITAVTSPMAVLKIGFPADSKISMDFEGGKAKLVYKFNGYPRQRNFLGETKEIDGGRQTIYFEKRNVNRSVDEMLYIALKTADSFNVSFKVLSCLSWNKVAGKLDGKDCRVGEFSDNKLECFCNQLSTLTSAINFNPEIFAKTDIQEVYLKINVAFIVSIVLALIATGSVLVWVIRRKDHSFEFYWVKSNDPSHQQFYLIKIESNSRKYSKVSSKIYIKIIGETSDTNAIQLNDKNVKINQIFQTNFLVSTPKCLGNLKNIKLWHDCSGPHHTWHCSSVKIRDINSQLNYHFPADKWFSLVKRDAEISYEIPEMSRSDDNGKAKFITRRFFDELFRCGKAKKFDVILMLILIPFVMLLNSVFLGRTDLWNFEEEMETFKKFDVRAEYFWFAVLSSVIFVMTFWIVKIICFKFIQIR